MTPPNALTRRLLTPLVLVGPLTIAISVPALVYGQLSNNAVASAERALSSALVVEGDYATVAPEFLCPSSVDTDPSIMFPAAAVDGPHTTALTGIGFSSASSEWTGKHRITMELRREQGAWCLVEVRDRA